MTKNEFASLLTSELTGKAIVLLFREQTSDEQSAKDTLHDNKRGFASWAAKRGTYYASWVQSGRSLSGLHLDRAKTIVLYHWKQTVKLGLFSGQSYRPQPKEQAPALTMLDIIRRNAAIPRVNIRVADASSMCEELRIRDPFFSSFGSA